MATNYAQKLERERQSPKGNLTKKENIGGLRKLTTDTGYMKANKRNEKIYVGIQKVGKVLSAISPTGLVKRAIKKENEFDKWKYNK